MDDQTEETTTLVVYKNTRRRTWNRNGDTEPPPDRELVYEGRSIHLRELEQNPDMIKLVLESSSMQMTEDDETPQALVVTSKSPKIADVWVDAAAKSIIVKQTLDATTYMMACAIQQRMGFKDGMSKECLTVLKDYLKDLFKPYKASFRKNSTTGEAATMAHAVLQKKRLEAAMKHVNRCILKCIELIESLVRDVYICELFLFTSDIDAGLYHLRSLY